MPDGLRYGIVNDWITQCKGAEERLSPFKLHLAYRYLCGKIWDLPVLGPLHHEIDEDTWEKFDRVNEMSLRDSQINNE